MSLLFHVHVVKGIIRERTVSGESVSLITFIFEEIILRQIHRVTSC